MALAILCTGWMLIFCAEVIGNYVIFWGRYAFLCLAFRLAQEWAHGVAGDTAQQRPVAMFHCDCRSVPGLAETGECWDWSFGLL